jgi:hypothetical protein
VVEQTFRVPGLTDDENRLVNRLAKQLNERVRRNRMRSDLYDDGKAAMEQISTVIPPQYHNIGLALGWATKGVDGLGRRCKLDRMVWTEGDLASLGIRELEDSNFLYSELGQAQTDSLIHGVSFLITTRGEDGEPTALVHAKDALNATGDWDGARTRRMKNLLSVTARDGDRITGFVLYLENETITVDKEAGKWVVNRSEHPWGVPVDPLIYRPRSSKRLGRSRITKAAVSLQKAAIREMVRLEGHMDVYSMPQLLLLGAAEAAFKNADGSQKASWQIALGRVLGIPDDEEASNPRADVKHIAAQSPEPHLADLNALAKLTAREYDLADSDFALTDVANPTSADSYSEARESLIAEAEDATDYWSVSVRRAVTRALAIQNGEDGVPEAWASITTDYRDPRFLSRAAVADAGLKQLSAVPWLAETRTGLKLLGLTELQIDEALRERTTNSGRQLAQSVLAARAGATGDAA